MLKKDPKRMEMIRRREKAGFCYVNNSYLAAKVEKAPLVGELEKLVLEKWWENPETMSHFVKTHNGDAAPVTTKLRIVYDNENIFAAFYMEEPKMDKTNTLITEQGVRRIKEWKELETVLPDRKPIPYDIEKDDSVELYLDLEHKNGRYVKFFINMAGVHFADEAEYSYAESVYPKKTYLAPWPGEYETSVKKGRDYWCAAFKIPWSTTGLKPDEAKVMGVNARRSRTVGEWNYFVLSFVPNFIAMSAYDFADLYLGEKPVEIEQIDFGFPVLDRNTFSMKIKNTSEKAIKLAAVAEITAEKSGEKISSERGNLQLAESESKTLQMKYFLDWHTCDTQKLRISMLNEQTGEEVISMLYDFLYLPTDHRFDFPEPQPDPEPSDENFLDKKRNYLLSRIPEFFRVTTTDGAPSDFTLRSTCGKYEFNLMKSGVLVEIADMIADIFSTELDRLAATSLLASQNAFSIHMGPHVALHTQITPLSALRLNAGHCYSRALVWLGIAKNIKTGKGEEVYGERAHAIFVLGHVMGAIDVGEDDRYLFDPSYGAFYYRWDNRNFATEKEIEKDLSLADRVIKGRRQNFVNVKYHRTIPAGQIVFPQLAPGE